MGDAEVVYAALGRAIRQARERKGLSVEELARRAGCSATYLMRVEEGAVQLRVVMLGRLAAALSMTVAGLLDTMNS